jgi:hypothetical protein
MYPLVKLTKGLRNDSKKNSKNNLKPIFFKASITNNLDSKNIELNNKNDSYNDEDDEMNKLIKVQISNKEEDNNYKNESINEQKEKKIINNNFDSNNHKIHDNTNNIKNNVLKNMSNKISSNSNNNKHNNIMTILDLQKELEILKRENIYKTMLVTNMKQQIEEYQNQQKIIQENTFLKEEIKILKNKCNNTNEEMAIDEELRILEKCNQSRSPVGNEEENKNGSPVGNGSKPRTMDIAGEDYGIGRMSVARLLRINELNDDLKKLVDMGNIKIRPAVELSYLSTEVQKMLYECMSRTGIDTISQNMAWELKELCKNQKDITPGMIEQILNGSNALSVRMDRSNRIALDREVFERYFKGIPKKEVVSIVEKALEMYFKGERA